jgi:hypothetical protein
VKAKFTEIAQGEKSCLGVRIYGVGTFSELGKERMRLRWDNRRAPKRCPMASEFENRLRVDGDRVNFAELPFPHSDEYVFDLEGFE